MRPAYTYLAQLYDHLMDEDYNMWCDYLISLLEKFGVVPESILDLGCGTGNLAIPLAQRGVAVTGVDISEEMVSLAQEKARILQVPLTLYVQDMRFLNLHNRHFDAVISACDALNYLTDPKSLSQAFANVSAHLVPNGLYLCDFNTEFKLRELYGDQSFADLQDGFAYFWDNSYDHNHKKTHMELTFFLENQDGLYEKVSEAHVQKVWDSAQVCDIALDCGLEQLGLYSFPTQVSPNESSERMQFVFQKVK